MLIDKCVAAMMARVSLYPARHLRGFKRDSVDKCVSGHVEDGILRLR